MKTAEARKRAVLYETIGSASWLSEGYQSLQLSRAIAEDESPKCRAAAAAALGKCVTAHAFESLSRLATSLEKDEIVMPGILSGLQATGDPGTVGILCRFTSYGRHPWIRERAVRCLSDLLVKQEAAKRDVKALETLFGLAADPSYRLRGLVVEKLGDLGDERAIAVLEKQIPKETDGRMVKDMRGAVRKIKEGSRK